MMYCVRRESFRIRTVFALGLSLCVCCGMLRAVDLSPLMRSEGWKGTYGNNAGALVVETVPNAMGENSGIRITGRPTKDQVNYAVITYRFDKPVNMSGMKMLTLFGQSSFGAKPRVTLECEGGKLDSNFQRAGLVRAFKKYELGRAIFKAEGKPNWAKVKGFHISFGLWTFDTRKDGFSLTLAKLACESTEDTYVIPLPTRGVTIDAQYKDWGFEDSLYNWYPPDYLYLNDEGHVVPGEGEWQGTAQLSGRFAFMMDDKKLYFLALVADATPFEGNDPLRPWKNDSVELFLGFKTDVHQLRLGEGMSKNGVQVIFDCGKDPTHTVVHVRGRPVKAKVERKTIPQTWVIEGRQVKGYVLEAALPLELLPIEKRERGTLIAYSIKLNDFSGIHLIATPDNLSPHSNIKAFRKAYVEIVSEKGEEIAFGPVAHEVFWPESYTEGEGRIRIWSMNTAHRKKVSDTIERVYLHSLWAVQGVPDSATGPDPEKWAYMPLPMGIGWYTPIFNKSPNSDDELGRELIGTSVLDRNTAFFWYERTFEPDAEFKGGKLFLNFEYVTKEALVYLNEEFVGTVDSARTALDVTGRVQSGQANRLDVSLYTTVSPGYSIRNGVGISGDIYLEHHRHAPVIEDVWVKNASGLDGTFEVVVEAKPGEEGRPVRLALDILDDNGEQVAHAERDATGRTTTLTGTCPPFKPWSPEHPNLFTLRVRCSRDGTVLDERNKRFGFRTFEIRNARFMLNGKVLRMRVIHVTNPGKVMNPGQLRELKRYGHNSIFMHAGHHGYNEPLFQKLDEEGFVIFAATNRAWPDARTVMEIRRYRSHPCVLGYVSDQFGQLDCNGFIHNPFSTSDTYYPEGKRATQIYSFLRKRYALFQSVDPTRPYFPHATGNFEGSFRTINHYPTYDLSLLDHMMYFAPWAERTDPQFPYHLYECGVHALISVDTTHPEHKFVIEEGRQVKRLLSYESAARYLGTEAFDNWRRWEYMIMRAAIRGFRICGIDGFTPWVPDDIFLDPCNTTKAQDIKDNRRLSYKYFVLPYKETMEDSWMRMNSWYYNLRAQARWQWPEEYGQGKLERKSSLFTPIYEDEMQPFFACIAGPSRDVFSLEHSYYSGEEIRRQFVAVNDTDSDADVVFEVSFALDGKPEKKSFPMHVRQGQILKQAFSFNAPRVDEKTRGTIRLEYVSPAGQKKEDSFAVTIFPKVDTENRGAYAEARLRPWKNADWNKKVGVAASPGKETLVAKMDVPFQAVSLDNEVPGDLDLLVIERNALAKTIRAEVVTRFIDQGGQVLILEQTDRSLFDWRLRERRLEAAFVADAEHPIVEGLNSEDFAFFRGPAAIVPREKRPSRFYRHTQSAALETPHLTNEGLVASYVFEKPCYGDFHPILVCGYDLEEAALVETRSGKGRAVFCQVDVTDRYGIDPAATRLADNMVRHLLQTKPVRKAPSVRYVGGPKGREFLDRLGIAHVEMGVSTARLPDILVVGDDVGKPVADFTRAHKTVVVLPFSDYLPKGMEAESVSVQQSDYPHYWNTTYYQFTSLKSRRPAPDRLGPVVGEAFRGLVDNDAYFFESPTLKAFKAQAGTGVTVEWQSEHSTMVQARIGKTRCVFCSADPYQMKHGECVRKAWRIWSVIFSNIGAANRRALNLAAPALDISLGDWTFLTDPEGTGDKTGYPRGGFGNRTPRPIRVGQIWEEQGVNDVNPNMRSAPDSAYDGFAWYFRKAVIPASVRGKTLYLHVDGVRDISTFNRTANQTDLWFNGEKAPSPVGIYNAKEGGRGARLWKLDPSVIKYGEENFVAIRVFNSGGAGGIHRKPVRFEVEGQNEGMMFPYEFVLSKYTPYFFWCW